MKDMFSLHPWEEKIKYNIGVIDQKLLYKDTQTMRQIMIELKDYIRPVKKYYGLLYYIREWNSGILLEYENDDISPATLTELEMKEIERKINKLGFKFSKIIRQKFFDKCEGQHYINDLSILSLNQT